MLAFQQHFVIGAIAVIILEQARQYNRKRRERREAILRHYVMLHPEDFPEPERKKIADIFTNWNVRR